MLCPSRALAQLLTLNSNLCAGPPSHVELIKKRLHQKTLHIILNIDNITKALFVFLELNSILIIII
jgi:hypothetical protein